MLSHTPPLTAITASQDWVGITHTFRSRTTRPLIIALYKTHRASLEGYKTGT